MRETVQRNLALITDAARLTLTKIDRIPSPISEDRVAKSDLNSTGAYLAKLAPKTRKLRKIRLHDKTL